MENKENIQFPEIDDEMIDSMSEYLLNTSSKENVAKIIGNFKPIELLRIFKLNVLIKLLPPKEIFKLGFQLGCQLEKKDIVQSFDIKDRLEGLSFEEVQQYFNHRKKET